MKRKSLVEAKANLSALVDDAEHHHATTLILRHGKPAAALVPVGIALGARGRKVRRPSLAEVDELLSGLGKGDPKESAVEDLLQTRR